MNGRGSREFVRVHQNAECVRYSAEQLTHPDWKIPWTKDCNLFFLIAAQWKIITVWCVLIRLLCRPSGASGAVIHAPSTLCNTAAAVIFLAVTSAVGFILPLHGNGLCVCQNTLWIYSDTADRSFCVSGNDRVWVVSRKRTTSPTFQNGVFENSPHAAYLIEISNPSFLFLVLSLHFMY